MKRFETAYTKVKEKKNSPKGTAVEPIYIMEYDKHGHKSLKQNGYSNTQERIQANLESTKVENIIRRCTDTGTLAAKLNQFIDATKLPKNLYEVQNTILRMKEEFAKLPATVRAKFDNSPEIYAANYGSEMWANALGIKKETAAEPVPEETKKEDK